MKVKEQQLEKWLSLIGLLGKPPHEILAYLASHERLFSDLYLNYVAYLKAKQEYDVSFTLAWCSFCQKNYQESGPFAEGPGQVYICQQCTRLCSDLLDGKEAPVTWRIHLDNKTPEITLLRRSHDMAI